MEYYLASRSFAYNAQPGFLLLSHDDSEILISLFFFCSFHSFFLSFAILMCLLFYAITLGRDCKLRHKRQESILFEMKLCKPRRPEGSFIQELDWSWREKLQLFHRTPLHSTHLWRNNEIRFYLVISQVLFSRCSVAGLHFKLIAQVIQCGLCDVDSSARRRRKAY